MAGGSPTGGRLSQEWEAVSGQQALLERGAAAGAG